MWIAIRHENSVKRFALFSSDPDTAAHTAHSLTFIKARASREIAAPVACQRLRLNDAAVVIGNAKLVLPGVDPELLT